MLLQNIHNRITTGFFAWLIIGLALFIFVLWGFGEFFNANRLGANKAAVVNGTPITWQQVYGLQQKLLQQRNVDPNNEQLNKIWSSMARNLLIERIAIATELRKQGVLTQEQDLVNAVNKIDVFKENGKFSKDLYYQVLKQNGFTEESFQQWLADNFIIDLAQNSLQNANFVTNEDLQSFVKIFEQTRDIQYAVLDPKKIALNEKITINANEINNFYQANQGRFKIPETVILEYLLLNEQQAEQASDLITDAAQSLLNVAEKLKVSLKQSKAIAQDIKFSSEDNPLLVKPVVIDTAFNEAMLAGNTSDILPLEEDKYLVFRVKEHIQATVKPLAIVEEEIKNILYTKTVQKKVAALGEKILAEVNSNLTLDNLDKVANKNKLVWLVYEKVNRTKAELDAAIRKVAFSLPVPSKYGNANPFSITGTQTTDGNYALVVVNKVNEALVSELPLDIKELYLKELKILLDEEIWQMLTIDLTKKAEIAIY